MPKTVPTAGDAMPKTTRRAFLAGAAASSLPVAAGTCVAATAIKAESAAPTGTAENPDLYEAYKRLRAATDELVEAFDDLKWISDEWRHRWPLAPEELLGVAGADLGYGRNNPERDILGDFIYRDCASLTKRLDVSFRNQNRKACFSIITVEDAEYWLDHFQKRKPKGRTPQSIAKSKEKIERSVAKYANCIELASVYEAETARLRQAAGVDAARERIKNAESRLSNIGNGISKLPAFTQDGLLIKALALKASGFFGSVRSDGVLMEIARLIDQIIAIGWRASA